MNPLGHRVSEFYHKALNPTTIPVVIDNKLFLLTEQLSRHIVDTKLSFLIPHPHLIFGATVPENSPVQANTQLQPDQLSYKSPMIGNVEQQIVLERMRNQYVIDMMNANANHQIASQHPSAGLTQPRTFHDASTHTFGLLQPGDVEMRPIP